ncbi:MAG TPA: aldo/keto reductase [Gemmatimonadaceae bacterium]|nr:aldo/keto reductase [Gemmatimonadaceae bacterium]
MRRPTNDPQQQHELSRRDAIRVGLGAGLAVALDRLPAPTLPLARERQAASPTLVTRAIPSSGERIPVVGLGTARGWDLPNDAERAARREVLRRFADVGGKVVDTAPAYGDAEQSVGELVADLAIRPKLFLATKVSARGGDAAASAAAQMESSMRRLRTSRVDLMQIWNLSSPDVLLPLLFEWKRRGRIRYVGITTSFQPQHEEMTRLMRAHPLDFVQVDYAIDNRAAADRILPLAADRGQAVLVNLPFGRTRVFDRVRGRALPDWAKEIGATSWAQLFLEYVVGHPAVTCAIPGTTSPDHVVDNLGAARGSLPDAAMRKRIETYFDALPASS